VNEPLAQIQTTERISDTVYGALRDAILTRALKAGESLSVPELARRLGVSRSPVREAVLQLVSDGLAVSEPRKGAVVAQPDEDALLAIHDVRELLEGLSVRRAAQKIQRADVMRLEALLKEQRRAVKERDAALFESTDEAFHAYISEINPEVRLLQFLRVLRNQMQLAVSVAMANPQHLQRAHLEHTAILKALRANDPEAAEAAMRAHITGAKERVAQTLRTAAQNSGDPLRLSEVNGRKHRG